MNWFLIPYKNIQEVFERREQYNTENVTISLLRALI